MAVSEYIVETIQLDALNNIIQKDPNKTFLINSDVITKNPHGFKEKIGSCHNGIVLLPAEFAKSLKNIEISTQAGFRNFLLQITNPTDLILKAWEIYPSLRIFLDMSWKEFKRYNRFVNVGWCLNTQKQPNDIHYLEKIGHIKHIIRSNEPLQDKWVYPT